MGQFIPMPLEQLDGILNESYPYIWWAAVRDARTPPQHRLLESSGIEGTALYRRDDPFFADWWPLRARWHKRGRTPCRCGWVDLSIKDAAKRFEIREAVEWYRTKEPPTSPAWVTPLGFDPWDLKLVAKCRRS